MPIAAAFALIGSTATARYPAGLSQRKYESNMPDRTAMPNDRPSATPAVLGFANCSFCRRTITIQIAGKANCKTFSAQKAARTAADWCWAKTTK